MIAPGDTVDHIWHMDALEFLRQLPSRSVDVLFTDPPYAEIDRDYGRLDESAWLQLMQSVAEESKRILKPTGSALFVLQPNSGTPGRMRSWLWEFMVWVCREWNMVQDAYWWNFTALPTSIVRADIGLMRPSVKTLVWCGRPDCYRDQNAVLWQLSDALLGLSKSANALRYHPSGAHINRLRMYETASRRGGSTPFNLLPLSNTNSATSGGAYGHSAATPAALVDWWLRYISKPGDLICDPFIGSGTTALVAHALGRHFIGCDLNPEYVALAQQRLSTSYTLPMEGLL